MVRGICQHKLSGCGQMGLQGVLVSGPCHGDSGVLLKEKQKVAKEERPEGGERESQH